MCASQMTVERPTHLISRHGGTQSIWRINRPRGGSSGKDVDRCETSSPVALLEFLTRAAGAGIVAAHFFLRADYLLHRLHIASARHARLFQFAALAAHERFFQIVGGSGDQAWRVMAIAS